MSSCFGPSLQWLDDFPVGLGFFAAILQTHWNFFSIPVLDEGAEQWHTRQLESL